MFPELPAELEWPSALPAERTIRHDDIAERDGYAGFVAAPLDQSRWFTWYSRHEGDCL